MSNACKNSLLVIAAVIMCAAISLFASEVSAEELYFPVNTNVSFVAPDIEIVFAGHESESVVVTGSAEIELTIRSIEAEIRNLEIEIEHITITANTDMADTDTDKEDVPQTDSATSATLTIASATEGPLGYTDLYFPVTKKVSFNAPNMDEVFFTNQEYSTSNNQPN